jgi:peptide/nickel transport system permease protein
MLVYVVRRIAMLIPILFGVLLITFVLMQAIPGSPVERLVGQAATEEEKQRIEKSLGLDKPKYVQFAVYMRNLARLDLGKSFGTKEDIGKEMVSRLPNTIRLATFSMLIASALGIAAGVISAVWTGRWPDHLVRVISIFGLSTPVFWFGLMLVLVFARWLQWLPPSGDGGARFSLLFLPGFKPEAGFPWFDFKGYLYLILPALTLGLRPAAFIGRIMRSQMLEVLSMDYVRTARAKGLAPWPVVVKHAMSNALIPVVTMIGVDIGALLAGSVITETVFSYRGLGTYTLEGIRNREHAIVMGTVLLTSVLFVIANLVVDIVCGYLDPRLRVTEAS